MKQVHKGIRYAGVALVLMLTLASILTPMAAQAAAAPAPAEAVQGSYGYGSCSTYHYVRHGETLSQIAANYRVSVQAIMQANGIRNPNHIYAGQKLCIPGGGGHPGPDWGNCYTYHYVKHGQTLSGIAAYYGVSVHALMRANGISNPNHIYAGQKLCIPGGGSWQPQPPPDPQPPVHPRPPADGCTYHLVKPGQTLSGIAAYYGVSVHSLMYLNGISNPNHLYVGQWLKISCNTPPPNPCGNYHPCPPPPPPPVDPCYTHPPVNHPSCPPVPCGHPCQPLPPPPPQPPVDPCHQPCHPPSGGSWTGSYYNNQYLEGSPTFIRQDAEVRFNWYTGSPGSGIGEDRFSVRWERDVYFESGHYRFLATSDDGVRVYIDGIKVIDGWNVHPLTEYAQDVYIHGGNHKVVVEYFEETGEAQIYVRWGRR